MKKKNLILIVFLYFLSLINVEAIEADIFVQSTVNRASTILSKDISKNDKIEELKIIAKETVDIEGIGFYTLGNYRKDMNEDELSKYASIV